MDGQKLSREKNFLYQQNRMLYEHLKRAGIKTVEMQYGSYSTFFGLINQRTHHKYSLRRAKDLHSHLCNLARTDRREDSITYWVTVGLFIVLLAITAYICVTFY